MVATSHKGVCSTGRGGEEKTSVGEGKRGRASRGALASLPLRQSEGDSLLG
jgi:hypothetical protein